jgi:hypothetical protein
MRKTRIALAFLIASISATWPGLVAAADWQITSIDRLWVIDLPFSKPVSSSEDGVARDPISIPQPVPLAPGKSYSVEFVASCQDGRINVEAGWDFGNNIDISIDGSGVTPAIIIPEKTQNGMFASLNERLGKADLIKITFKNNERRKVTLTVFRHRLSCNVRAIFDRVWREHNIDQDNQKGMRVHSHFVIRNQRGETINLKVRVSYDNGKALLLAPKSDKDFDAVPTYLGSEYKDLWWFIPYKDLNVPVGVSKLKTRFEVYDKDTGMLLAASDYITFSITRRG